MRPTIIRTGTTIITAFLCLSGSLEAAGHADPRRAPLEAHGVLCEQAPGEMARTSETPHRREVTYTGVVLSDDERVAGTLQVVLSLTRDRGRTQYTGRIAVQPTALGGQGTWEGSLRGDIRGAKGWDDPAALALEIVHRRTVLRPNRSGPTRTARPSEARVVRRVLRGSGTLDGMRLVFDHRAHEGVAPAAIALPTGCLADYELWSGVVADVRP